MAQTIDNTSAFVETTAGTSHSFSVTLGSGTSRKIIVFVQMEQTGSISSATFDSASMNAVTLASGSNPGAAELVTKVFEYDVDNAKGTGTYTVSFTTSVSTSNCTAYYYQMSGAASGSVEYASLKTADNTVTAVSDTAVSCSTGAVLLAMAAGGSATPTWSWNATVAERTESNETNYTTACADASAVSAGTKTVTATASSTAGFKNLAIISIAEAAAAGISITSVNAGNDVYSGQTLVKVVGTGLSNVTSATYKGVACTAISKSSSLSITMTFPNFFTNNIKVGAQHALKVRG